MKRLLFLLPCVLLLGGCAKWSQVTDSTEFSKLCEWSPVAVVAIEGAAQEAMKDPNKVAVGQSLAEAAGYIRLVSSLCPKPA